MFYKGGPSKGKSSSSPNRAETNAPYNFSLFGSPEPAISINENISNKVKSPVSLKSVIKHSIPFECQDGTSAKGVSVEPSESLGSITLIHGEGVSPLSIHESCSGMPSDAIFPSSMNVNSGVGKQNSISFSAEENLSSAISSPSSQFKISGLVDIFPTSSSVGKKGNIKLNLDLQNLQLSIIRNSRSVRMSAPSGYLKNGEAFQNAHTPPLPSSYSTFEIQNVSQEHVEPSPPFGREETPLIRERGGTQKGNQLPGTVCQWMENPDDSLVQGEILRNFPTNAASGKPPLGNVPVFIPSPQHTIRKSFLSHEGMGELGGWHRNPADLDAGMGVENVRSSTVLHNEPGGPCSDVSPKAQWDAACIPSSISPINAIKEPYSEHLLAAGQLMAHLEIERTPVDHTLIGSQIMGVQFAGNLRVRAADVCVTTYLQLETGVLDYVVNCKPLRWWEVPNPQTSSGDGSSVSSSSVGENHGCYPVNQYNPNLVLISETRVGGNRAEEILATLGFTNHFKVDPMGYAGGLWLLWDNEQIAVTVHEQTFQEIHTTVEVNGYPPFFASFIYASPDRERRKILWNNLIGLAEFVNLPWILGGDFNDILHADEKWGGLPASVSRMRDFNNCVNGCNLLDLGFTGSKYTWWNKRPNGTIIFERLDRFLASADWLSIFPQATNYHLPRIRSDHNPIFLTSKPLSSIRDHRPFRCERIWLNQPGFAKLTKESWQANPPLFLNLPDFTSKIKNWNKKDFGDLFYRKRKILNRLEGIQRINNPCQFLASLEIQLSLEYQEILVLEEEFWASKARVDWPVTNLDDRLINDSALILISSTSPSELEIFDTLSQLKPFKAPGLDGFQPGFFQKYWTDVKESLCTEIRDLFRDPQLIGNWNETFICLIPKVNNPTEIQSFRPISLCNTIYKIVAKILVNRLKSIIPNLISFNQGAFFPGRKSIDNVVIAQELMASIKKRKRNKFGWMMIKLDLEKAYDKISWKFILRVLVFLKFPSEWTSLIEKCINSVHHSILFNGGAGISGYFMQILPFPISVCSSIDKIFRDFFWQSLSKGKIHMIGWDKICMNKKRGGLSIMKSRKWNLAFLGKLAWRVHQEPNSIWTKVCSYRRSLAAHRSSLIVKSIDLGFSVLNKGSCKIPMSGIHSNFWGDNWSRFGAMRNLIEGPLNLNEEGLRLSEISSFPGVWEWEKISFDLPPEIKHSCMSCFINRDSNQNDILAWGMSSNGIYTVKSAYDLLIDNTFPYTQVDTSRQTSNLSWIWKCGAQVRILFFLWCIWHNGLPTKNNLLKRGLSIDPLCPLCSQCPESVDHLFRECAAINSVWQVGHFRVISNTNSFKQWVKDNSICMNPSIMGIPHGTIFIHIIWSIWLSRNGKSFKNEAFFASNTWKKASSRAAEFYFLSGFDSDRVVSKIIERLLWELEEGFQQISGHRGYHNSRTLGYFYGSLLERQPLTSLNHTFREANACADGLAKRAVEWKYDLCLFSVVPSFISSVFEADRLGVSIPCRIDMWWQIYNRRKKFSRRTPINVDSSSEHSEAFNRDASIPMKKATALKEDEDLSSYSPIFQSLPSTHGSPIKGDRLIKAKLYTLESSANKIDGDIQELKKDFEHFKKTTKKHHKKIMSMLSKIYKSLN
ncbi:reverse transcriptase [Senna tora]|uniref:Reverse transcriptase n=1 Tax=Senna tora TaxID=362788 RepID=A0A834TRK2_9FABA|nr:reverse transcriptase [Senna tora]